MQSIEHALRALDKGTADEGERLARCEKMLADYREQLGKPFAHEARLNELLAKQNELMPRSICTRASARSRRRMQLTRMMVMAGLCALPPTPMQSLSLIKNEAPAGRGVKARRQPIHKRPTLRPGL
jgi:hypothetical protein